MARLCSCTSRLFSVPIMIIDEIRSISVNKVGEDDPSSEQKVKDDVLVYCGQ